MAEPNSKMNAIDPDDFKWDVPAEHAFRQMLRDIQEEVFCCAPDYQLPWMLEVDWSC